MANPAKIQQQTALYTVVCPINQKIITDNSKLEFHKLYDITRDRTVKFLAEKKIGNYLFLQRDLIKCLSAHLKTFSTFPVSDCGGR